MIPFFRNATCYYLLLLLSCGTIGHLMGQSDEIDHQPVHRSDSIVQQHKPKKFEWILPASLISGGTIIGMSKHTDEFFLSNKEIWETRNEHFPNFHHHADNYLQYAPTAATFALSLLKVKGRNSLSDQAILCIKSELLMTLTVTAVKKIVGETRPDSFAKNSCPSGHTAQAFAAATMLAIEYGNKSVWYTVGAYTLATSVGAMRILNNRHWMSDVLIGAGIGMLSTRVVYATHKFKPHKANKRKSSLSVSPTFSSGSTGMYCSLKF